MQVCVVLASGFIGRHLAGRLAVEGLLVVAPVARMPAKPEIVS